LGPARVTLAQISASNYFVYRDGNDRHKFALELLEVRKELEDSKQKVQVC